MSTWTLVIDTATGINIGLGRDGAGVESRTDTDSRRHVERLQPMIIGLLAAHGITVRDLATIGVGVGPGPFTGLRIGITTARTLGLVAGVAVRGFVTLDAIALTTRAAGAVSGGEFVVVTDARRKELYWATYTAEGMRVGGPKVSAPDHVPDLPVAGPGVEVFPEIFEHRSVLGTGHPHLDAALVAARLDELPDEGLEPQYLRSPDAEVPRTRKSALAAGRLRLPKGALG